MQAATLEAPSQTTRPMPTQRYAKCIEASKRIRWDIDRDVIRGRQFDFDKKFLPDGLSKVNELSFLRPGEMRFLSQIQGRTYANIFGLVERFIAAKVLDVSRDHGLGDQNALEALVRFADEEIKHQELFRRIERMCAGGMPEGYTFLPEPNAVASAVLAKSTWAVLALTCHIELFVLAHYRESIGTEADVSELWKDVFLFHWKEESQHAILDELEWRREHARLNEGERDHGVTDLIELVAAVDGILQMQAHLFAFRADRDPRRAAEGLPLAIHRERRAGAAVRRGVEGAGDAGADGSHRQSAVAHPAERWRLIEPRCGVARPGGVKAARSGIFNGLPSPQSSAALRSKERTQFPIRFVGRLLGRIMPARQHLPANVGRPFEPCFDRLIAAVDVAALAP